MNETFVFTVLVSVVIVGVAMAAIGIGLLLSGKQKVKGSCGGLAGMKDDRGQSICEACTNPSPDCQGKPEGQSSPAAP